MTWCWLLCCACFDVVLQVTVILACAGLYFSSMNSLMEQPTLLLAW
jgi:hypothetical protein